jgi:SepF-like predicted cell division protein (DUF552 family)
MGFLSLFRKSESNSKPTSSIKSSIPNSLSKINSNSGGISQKVFIKHVLLNSAEDLNLLQANLYAGNIIVVNLTALLEKQKNATDSGFSLQSCIGWLKQYCVKNGGSVGKLKDNLFIVLPNKNFSIHN